MCVVSMVMDYYSEEWEKRRFWSGESTNPMPHYPIHFPLPTPEPLLTPEEVAAFRRLLERAQKYDVVNNEPNCELEAKKEKIKALAKELGVEIDFL